MRTKRVQNAANGGLDSPKLFGGGGARPNPLGELTALP